MATETKTTETVEKYFKEVADRYGVDNWKAIDMAIHTKKFVDFQKALELGSQAHERAQEDGRVADLARRRKQRLEKARDRAQFRKSWLEAGHENWRKNQLVKFRRQRRERQFRQSLLEKKKAVERRKKEKSAAEACEGISWIENRMDSLGISSHKSADTAVDLSQAAHKVASESGTDFLQRIEGQVASVTKNPEEVAALLAALKIRGNQNRTARQERELRRQKMDVDQQREHAQLELKKKEDRVFKLCRQYSRALEAVALLKWKKATKKLQGREARAARIAQKKQRFDDELDDAFEKFSMSARERQTEEAATAIRSKINEMRRISRERKLARAKIVCQETVDKLVDLMCCVLREREQREDQLMSEPKWREIKERFVSGHPFFEKRMQTIVTKGDDLEADMAAMTEIKEFSQGSGSWKVDRNENLVSLAKEPTAIALKTMHELISETPPSIRPDRVSLNFSQCDIRMSVTGDAGALIDATTTACANHGMHAVTISKVVERALQIASGEDTSRTVEPTKAEKKLRENGNAIAKVRAEAAQTSEAGSEEIALPDVLLVDTLIAYLDELNENQEDQNEGAPSTSTTEQPTHPQSGKAGSWILAGFPRTTIQAKLLEHHLSNYSDPDVDAALAAFYKKGNKKDTKKDQGPLLLTSSPSAVLIVGNSNPGSIAERACDDNGQYGIGNEESPMHDLEKWWSALNPNTISSRAFSHQQIEEEVDVLIEVCHDRLQSETKKLGDDGLEVLEEDAETKANDGAKLGDPAEMRGKNETRTIHDDILEKVKSRVDALSLRIWRAHVLGERTVDRVRINEAVTFWEAEEEAYAAALDSFVYAFHEQNKILRTEVLSASERFRSQLRLDGNLWDSITKEARDQLNNLEFGIADAGWSQLAIVCEVERRLRAAVNERKETAVKVLHGIMAGLEVPLKEALERLSVSAVLLAAAEASHFLCGLRLLHEYSELVDDKGIGEGHPDYSQCLLDMLSSLERVECVAEVRQRAIDASKLVAPYVHPDSQAPSSSDAVVLACHFVRRLHSIMRRLNVITSTLQSSTFNVGGSLIARIEQRHSEECTTVEGLIRACLSGKGKPILFELAMECKNDNLLART